MQNLDYGDSDPITDARWLVKCSENFRIADANLRDVVNNHIKRLEETISVLCDFIEEL